MVARNCSKKFGSSSMTGIFRHVFCFWCNIFLLTNRVVSKRTPLWSDGLNAIDHRQRSRVLCFERAWSKNLSSKVPNVGGVQSKGGGKGLFGSSLKSPTTNWGWSAGMRAKRLSIAETGSRERPSRRTGSPRLVACGRGGGPQRFGEWDDGPLPEKQSIWQHFRTDPMHAAVLNDGRAPEDQEPDDDHVVAR